MSDIYGWAGKVLRVDLTSGEIWTDDVTKYVPKFIGGIGIAFKIIWDEVGPNVKAFDPDNRLIFASGPATGSYCPSSGRCEIAGISPQTYPLEVVGRSGFGGQFAAEMKFAGYDLIVFQGKAKKPVYLSVVNDKVKLMDASRIWGQDTFQTQQQMKRELGDNKAKTVACGPAGENLVRWASVLSDTGHGSGQCGYGAVMGSKNLKGIVIRGTKPFNAAASPKELLELGKYAKTVISDHQSVRPSNIKGNEGSRWRARPGLAWEGGTERVYIGDVDYKDMNRIGLRANAADFYASAKVYPYHVKNTGCFSCPVMCFSLSKVPSMKNYGMPELGELNCVQFSSYGPPAHSGGDVIFLGKQLVDTLGLNSYTMGGIVKLIRWMNQNGLTNEKDSGIPFSDEDNGDGGNFINTLARMCAYREGIGDLFADDLPRVAEKLGLYKEMWEGALGTTTGYFAHGFRDHYNPRTYGYANFLTWICENRDPNRHDQNSFMDPTRAGIPIDNIKRVAVKLFGSDKCVDDSTAAITPYDPAKGKYAMFVDHRGQIKDSLTACDWIYPNYLSPQPERDYAGDITLESQYFSAVTGVKTSMEQLDKMGERSWNMYRAITVREWLALKNSKDLRNEHDIIAEWNYIYPKDKEPYSSRGARLNKADTELVKDDYYKQRGWDLKTGIPTRAKLEELDLKDVADDLQKRGLI